MDPMYWGIILVALGFGVIFLELFIPSAGILGIVAAILLLSGVVLGFMQNLMTGTVMLLVTGCILPVFIAALIKVWPSTPIGKRILIGDLSKEEYMPQTESYTQYKALIGQLGIAKTKMLPSGIVVINDKKYDALSDGFPIEEGQAIRVTAVKNNRILIQPYDGKVEAGEDLPARDEDVFSQPIEELGIEPFESLSDDLLNGDSDA